MIPLYLCVAVLIVLTMIVSGYALTESRAAQAQARLTQAFYLAEAGLDAAMAELRDDFNWTEGFASQPLGANGNFSVEVETDGDHRILTATGTVAVNGFPMQRILEAVVRQDLPDNFYDNAIYSADEVTFNGNAYQVTGNVLSGTQTPSGTNVTGEFIEDPTANPLPALNYNQLYDLAYGQGNVYDADRLDDVQNNADSFPGSFWRVPPTDPSDPTTGVPNIVYITTDLALSGNIGNIGGFFVVVGDVLTDPSAVEDATINGNGTVDGPIYTRGQFRINGGGGRLNVNGGVWSGTETRLNGNANVTYNQDYMTALQALVQADVQIILWGEGTAD